VEVKTELKDYNVRYYCNDCGTTVAFTGKMVFYGENVGKYVHECLKCRQILVLEKKYPYTIKREVMTND